jgi:H+/gluconate symporter-like permease
LAAEDVADIPAHKGVEHGSKGLDTAPSMGSVLTTVLSHVNDAGFWLVKEYFQLSLPDTFKSWTAMETLLSVLGLVFVLLLSLLV